MRLDVPNFTETTYQNGGDNEGSVGQRIRDIVGPVFVAVCHVEPTVGVPNPNLHKTQHIRGCQLSKSAFTLRGPFYTRNGHKSLQSGTPGITVEATKGGKTKQWKSEGVDRMGGICTIRDRIGRGLLVVVVCF